MTPRRWKPKTHRKRELVEELERRILYSADLPVPDLAGALLDPDQPAPVVQSLEPRESAASAAAQQSAASHELVFVDSGVKDYQDLVDDLLRRSTPEHTQIVVLDAERDGIEQIGEVLAGHQGDVSAVHVLSHGNEEGVQIGGTWLTRESLAQRADAVGAWGAALTQDSDFLLYGCDLASSDPGQALVSDLAALTGADVGASVDWTGSALLGGDWDLEFHSGSIESAVLQDDGASASWSGLLVNHAPVLSSAFTVAPTPINEDAVASSGDLVSTLLGSGFSDSDAGALRGIAITTANPGNGTWQYSLDGGSSWTAVGSPSGASSLLLRDTDRVRFVPNAQNSTTATFSYRAWDQTTGSAGSRVSTTSNGGATAYSTATATATLNVSAVNDAPVLAAASPSLTAITEDATGNTGNLVSSLLGATVSDVDTGALQGIALTGLTSGNGTWQYSTNGGTSWTSVGAVSNASALLLRSTDKVRFVPDTLNADTASFSYVAWDQSSGVVGTKVNASAGGGTSAFSTQSNTASIAVSAVNDAPVMSAAAPSLTVITEDATANAGDLVSSLLGATVSDVDTGALQGIAITGLTSSNGTWQYSTNGGSTWTSVGTVSSASALLLRSTDGLRFVPDTRNADTATFSYVAWDQATGSAGTKVSASATGGTTAFSVQSNTASIAVSAVNDAPVLVATAPVLTAVESDTVGAGDLVSTVLGSSVSDVDTAALEGIAVTGLTGTGTWRYSTNGGGSWTDIGAVSGTSSLLLRATDRILFVASGPSNQTATVSYRAWDQSSGSVGSKVDSSATGGSSAFSTATDTASVFVNDAPTMVAASPALPTIDEDTANPGGALISTLLGASVSDVNTGAAQGVAITALSSASGTWQYSTNAGSTWTSVGAVSGSSALLLRASDKIRFVPGGGNGESASFSYRAWDQTSGAAGSKVDPAAGGAATAFSTASNSASITVTAVNDAPILSAVSPALTSITEDQLTNSGNLVSSLLGGASDVDSGAAQGIAVTGTTPSNGTWQYSTDAGSSWSNIGSVSALWADSAWAHRQTLTLDHTQVAADQTDFPVLVTFTDPQLAAGASADGHDIFFTSSDGLTRLSHEIESYDSSTGKITAWVRVPSVSASTDTTLYMYYGNAAASNQQNPSGVWDANYQGVWHLGDGDSNAAGFYKDSTTHVHNGTLVDTDGSVTQLNGQFGKALDFSTPDADYIQLGASSDFTMSSGTLDVWLKTGAHSGTITLLNMYKDAFNRSALYFDGSNGDRLAFHVNEGGVMTTYASANTTLADNQWHHVSVTWGASGAVIRVDYDAATGTDAGNQTIAWSGSTTAQFAQYAGGPGFQYNGAMDEVRYSNTVRSDSWLQTQYNNQRSPAAFLSVGSEQSPSDPAALLLRATDRVRFVPDGLNADTASFQFNAWDQTSGTAGTKVGALTGGTTAFSSASASATIAVTAVNDAPVMSAAAPSLTAITEDATGNAGDLVSSLLGATASDVDTGALQGIAITGLTSGNGTWQFSTNGGSSWTNVGAVSSASALLVRATDKIRFVPDARNADAATFSYVAWDQSSGTTGTKVNASVGGGTAAFSAQSNTASIAVSALNDAPVLTAASPSLTAITEDVTASAGDLISSLLGATASDVDTGAAVPGIAITGLTSTNGTWQYSTNGGSSWVNVGAVSSASALLLRSTDKVRFVPDARNADTPTFSYVAWDQTTGSAGTKVNASATGGTTAFSAQSNTASIAVSAVNDAPVMTAAATSLTAITEDATTNAGNLVSSLLGATVSDVDTGALQGIAITGLTSGNGTWAYSLNGGTSWINVGAVSSASALLLRSTDKIRFVPDALNADTATFSYVAWDQSSGAAGSKVDASVGGGTAAFSTQSNTASIAVSAVNDAPLMTAASPSLTAINEDATGNPGNQISSLLGATVSDVDTGALQGIAITGLTSGNGTWQYSTNGGSSWTSVGTVSSASSLLLRSSDWVRFVPDARNADTATFSYRAWDQSTGSVGSKVSTATTGGTAAFSAQSNTASIAVSALNDAPVIGTATTTLTTITEDATGNAGDLVSTLLGSSVTDVDTGALSGIAILGLTSGTGTWQYSTNGGTSWQAMSPVSATSALLLRGTDRVRLVPDGLNSGTASFSYQAWDQTSDVAGTRVNIAATGGTTAYSSGTGTASLTVTAVNDAPLMTAASPSLAAIDEDATGNAGNQISSLLGATVSDVDTGALQGIAITGLASGNGTWQFSTNGGSSWTNVGTVSSASSLLLRASDWVRFVPDARNADTATFSYLAWDQSTGSAGSKVSTAATGGTTAFSAQGNTASISVSAVNDAPALAAASPSLTSITEDNLASAGDLISSLLASSISDVDLVAPQGIAITGLTSGNGTWQYSTDAGTSWSGVGAVSNTSALLLRSSDKLRFVPDGRNADAGTVIYRAWDQSTGALGSKVSTASNGGTTAFSSSTNTASIAVTAVNDAPVMSAAAPSLTAITEDATGNAGNQISSLLGATVSDVDTAALQGIAITGLTSGNGTWQYSTNGGSSWTNVGAVSSASSLLLRSSDWVRFVPDARNADTATFSYRAWDQSTGSVGSKVSTATTGGTAAFSAQSNTASIAVSALNDAPVMSAAAPSLTAITEDATGNAGNQISSLLGATVSDVDTGALQGIAITGLTSGNGTWQYSMDGGSSWTSVGTVSSASSLLLRSSDWVRFVPDARNADTATFSYRAWDQSTGSVGSKVSTATTGGTAAFSAQSNTASIAVSALNDAPVMSAAAPSLTAITEDATGNAGDLVSSLLGATLSDVDTGALQGIAITGLASGNGTWQYSTNAGSSWTNVGAVSSASALLLRATDRVRFVPDGSNADAATFSYVAWDQSSGTTGTKVNASVGGGTAAFSTQSNTASIAVSALNDAPVMSAAAPSLTAITEDATSNAGDLISSLLGATVSDVDAGALQGVAITALTSGNGTWQYSMDGGSSWSGVGAVSSASALLLRASDRIRFVPDARNADAATFSYQAWDQTSGSAGSKVNATATGGTAAFSAQSNTATVAVSALNDAPVIASSSASLSAILIDDLANTGDLVSALLASSVTDVDSGALGGVAITAVTSGPGTWQYSTDGGSSWLDVGPVSGSSALLLRDSDRVRVLPDGMTPGSATFSYRAWDRTSDVAGTRVSIAGSGGTTAYSSATGTATVTVNSPNKAPVLAPAAPSLGTITEDDPGGAGTLISSVLGSSVSDQDAGALQGIAITGLASGNGTWQYSTNGGSTWSNVGAVSSASSLLLRSSDWIRFVPDARNADTASFSYLAWDQATGLAGNKVSTALSGGGTAFSVASDTASISVSAVNDAPVLAPATPSFTGITEDDLASAGDLVSSLLASASDVDLAAPQGVAITGLTSGNGAWQYSTNGGSSWSNVGTVSNTSALLLRSSDKLRFVPDGRNADAGTLIYRAWDQSTGALGSKVSTASNGGTTAFSSSTNTASIAVAVVNDAPVLAPVAPSLGTITEDDTSGAGTLISSVLGSSVGDVDASAQQGVAITSLASGNGTWQYSTNGGSSWTSVGAVSSASALLLRSSDRIRFVPDARNADTASFSYVAWDQTTGATGTKVNASVGGGTTAFSTAADTASISVSALNDAPLMAAASPNLAGVTEDDLAGAGDLVSSLLAASVSDVDLVAPQGIAVIDGAGPGLWQYSTNGGSSWSNFGSVSGTSALLLRSTDRIRFVPDGRNGGSATFIYRAWDQSAGAVGSKVNAGAGGGTTAFSIAANTASIAIAAVNDAPQLAASNPSLTAIGEDDLASAGDSIASLLGTSASDVDSGALKGIAVTSLSSGNGAWQFSTDGGATWSSAGSVSTASALLLRDTDRVRFVPDGLNPDAASFSYRAWDQTSGAAGSWVDVSASGGTTAFSSAAGTASIQVAAVNDAPLLSASSPVLATITEDSTSNSGSRISTLLGGSVVDVDQNGLQGIAVTGLASGNGAWQYSTNGGNSWSNVGAVSSASALLLRAVDRIRFVPDGANADAASFSYVAWDQSSGTAGSKQSALVAGGTTAFSTAGDSASIQITSLNDAPVLTASNPSLPSITEEDMTGAGETVGALLGTSLSDVDLISLQGIAITSLAGSHGSWEYSLDAGSTWQSVGSVSSHSALLLRPADLVRFVPDGLDGDLASFSYRGWDQSGGAAGALVDLSASGGTTAFSSESDALFIQVTPVNDAPSLGDAELPISVGGDSGETVQDLFDGLFQDVDGGANLAGIAVVGNGADPVADGTWEYSADGGTSWFAIGAVADDASALALSASTRVRFVPSVALGTQTALVVRGLDDSYSGAFSSGTGAAELRVQVDVTANGGGSAISASTAMVSTTLAAPPEPLLLVEAAPAELPPEAAAADPLAQSSAAKTAAAPRPAEAPATRAERLERLPEEQPGETAPSPRASAGDPLAAATASGSVDPAHKRAGAGVLGPAARVLPAGELLETQLVSALDRLRGELDKISVQPERTVVLSSMALSVGVSVGYMLWLTRGGLLVASLLSAMPAWRVIDPIPVLASFGPAGGEADRREDESLNSIVGRLRMRRAAARARAARELAAADGAAGRGGAAEGRDA